MAQEKTILKPSHRLSFNDAVWAELNIRNRTNCYAYALNCPELGRLDPGMVQGGPKLNERDVSADRIRTRLRQDGLVEVSEDEALSGQFHIVAFRVRTAYDYHFFRRNADGLWTHKPDEWVAATDNADNHIKDPRNASLKAGYKHFGGFWVVPENGILYTPRIKISSDTLALMAA